MFNMTPKAPDMRVSIGSLHLKNPVMTASGTFGYASEFNDLVDLNRIGAIIVKGLSLFPSRGNPPPRIAETASGMLNAIGLENIGIEAFAAEKLPFLKTLKTPTVANIYGTTVDEYVKLAARLDALKDVAGIEINISCPNVKAGGIAFGVDPRAAYRVVSAVRASTGLPLIVKLSPNVTDITVIAKSAVDAGADALSLINTLTGMAVDIGTRRPRLSNITGGLSGPAIKPVALRMVWQVVNCVNVPVIGIGGIATATDALEFLMVGATAVQVGTANFINPKATVEIVDGIQAFLAQQSIPDIHAFIGSMAKY